MGTDPGTTAWRLDFMRADIEEPGSSPAARLIAGHAALLLAAIEAVLDLADKYDTIPAYGPTPGTRHEVARRFREAIRAALSGEEAGDGG